MLSGIFGPSDVNFGPVWAEIPYIGMIPTLQHHRQSTLIVSSRQYSRNLARLNKQDAASQIKSSVARLLAPRVSPRR